MTHETSTNPPRCPRCGAAKSRVLAGNCPSCLIDLGEWDEPNPAELGTEEPSAPGVTGGPMTGVPPHLEGFELIEEIARGGMGVVYRARQLSLNRTVAVKVLVAGAFSSEAFVRRFRREAEAAAALHHPHIVAIHDIGEQEGRPYFSMELIEGRSLAEVVRESPVPERQAARWLQLIAAAVHYAHQHGVLHRDLKPSNVLVDNEGIPHVTDFGLAKRLDGSEDLTLTGQVLGSPNYMPPEQADPRRGATTAAGDVYALGAILFHLLTGRPPFLADSVTHTLRLAIEAEPVAPRLLNPALSRDLETICLKCLEKEPARRYGTAQELADELDRFLRDEPIRARPIGPVGRLRRWRRRKPALAASLAAGAILLLVVVIGSPVAVWRIQDALQRAENLRHREATARHRAESAERATEAQLYTALLEQSRAIVGGAEIGQRVQTLAAIRRAASISNSMDVRREALAALSLCDLRFERELPMGPDCTMTALDPTFSRWALGRGTNAVEIQSVPDLKVLAVLPPQSPEAAFAGRWSADGRFLAIRRKRGINGAQVEIWSVESTADVGPVLLLPPTPFGAGSFHPREHRFIADAGDGTVNVWDLGDGQVRQSLAVTGQVHHLEYSPDGRSVLVQHRIGMPWFTSLLDADTGAIERTAMTGWIDGVAWDPTGRWLAFALRNGEVHLHNRQTKETVTLGRHKREARTAAFTADGNFLFTGGEEQEVLCWDVRRRERVFTIGPRSLQVQTSASGARCAVVTSTTVRLHTLERPTAMRDLPGALAGGFRHAAFSPDGRWLAASGEYFLGLWDWKTDATMTVPFSMEDPVPFFSPDSQELFAFWFEELRRWQVQSANNSMPTDAPPRLTALPVPKVARVFSGLFVGEELILGTSNGVLCSPWKDLSAGKLNRQSTGATYIAPSADGHVLAIAKGGWMQFFQLSPWKGRGLADLGSTVLAHGFTPRGDEMAAATINGVSFLETNRWQPARRLEVSLDRSARILFMPDGETFWLVRDVRNAALYSLATLEMLLALPSNVTPLALSADGRYLALEVDSRRLQVWDLPAVHQSLRDLGLEEP